MQAIDLKLVNLQGRGKERGPIKVSINLVTLRNFQHFVRQWVLGMLGEFIAQGSPHSSALVAQAHLTRKWGISRYHALDVGKRKLQVENIGREDITSGH